jgi:hypothetical protein
MGKRVTIPYAELVFRQGLEKRGLSYGRDQGAYYIDRAYGGSRLVQVMNEHGGIRAVTHGYCPPRELLDKIEAFFEGVDARSEER